MHPRRLMLGLASAVLWLRPMPAATLDEATRRLARDIFQQLIEINTTDSVGSTTVAAQAMAQRLLDAGFSADDVKVLGPNDRKGNMVARLRGAAGAGRKPVLIIGHLDVVEARRSDWTTDPFQFVEKDGYFYGRGTGDDKAQAAIWIANLIRYKKEGFTPDRDIIVALTADEEGGGPYSGIAWLLKNKRELIDAEYCLNEGGWGEAVDGKRVANDVQVSEKYVIDFRLEVRNKGGHSSLPVPDNAIYHLANALGRIGQFGFPLKTNDVTKAYFQAMSSIESPSIRNDLAQVAAGSQDAMKRVAAASPAWNSTLRTTCVATQIEGGHARNALPQLAAANVNCRVLPDDSPEYVESTLKKVIADDQVAVKVAGEIQQAPPSPMRQDLLQTVSRITSQLWPGVQTVPMMVMGATDGVYTRRAGIPTYGVQGIFFDRNDIRFHGRDERVKVQSFYEGQTFLYELVKSLAGGR